MKSLVPGGYGNFGARACCAMAGDANIELLVAGRDAGQGRRFADILGEQASAATIDCNAPTSAKPWLLSTLTW
ncbi:hypothetical protein ACTJIL_05280 [Luteimonas sp. 22616]|uniref:hypothetical protein n=1 Tax=Luteimonas sp. 22616 TaxID=3453951 RepID=UPI003F8554AC